jgi:hypothetical protein
MRHVDTLNSGNPLLTRTTDTRFNVRRKYHYEFRPYSGWQADDFFRHIGGIFDGQPIEFPDYAAAAEFVRKIQSLKYVCEPGESAPPTLTIVPVE